MLQINLEKTKKKLSKVHTFYKAEDIQKQINIVYEIYNTLVKCREDITAINSETYFSTFEALDRALRFLIEEIEDNK